MGFSDIKLKRKLGWKWILWNSKDSGGNLHKGISEMLKEEYEATTTFKGWMGKRLWILRKNRQRGKKKTACNGEETVSRGTFIIFKVTEIK